MMVKMWTYFVIATLLFNGIFCREIDLEDIWQNFKVIHGKSYSEAEERLRRVIFEDNVRMITQHNMMADLKQHSFELGINEFSDLTLKEFNERFSTLELDDDPSALVEKFDSVDINDLPSSIDYRNLGMVTPVENQGACGSCYSFASLGAVESAWKKANDVLEPLSKQNIIDCNKQSSGCKSGVVQSVYRYIIKNKGVDNQKNYPYEAKNGTCRFKPEFVTATVKSYKNVYRNEDALQKAVVTVGPIAVSMYAGLNTFKQYKRGVFSDKRCSGKMANHSLLVIGYGVEGEKLYWLVKNSWAKRWGEKGYIKVARNENNMCSVASYGSYPIVS